MKKFFHNLKLQAQANPVIAIVLAVTLLSTAVKLLQVSTERSNARTWKKEVERRSLKVDYK